jgi:hypothetical protein
MFRSARVLLWALVCPGFFGVGAAQERRTQQLPGWGEFVDPAKDCKVDEAKGRVTITVPGSHHNLNPDPEYNNVLGPRLLQVVEGDFQAQVKVLVFPKPAADTSATKQKLSYVAAGLFVWQDDKTFVRCFRAAVGERGDVFVHVEGFRDAKRLTGRVFIKKMEERNITDDALYIRVTRKGAELTVDRSMDGKDWTKFARIPLSGFAAKLHVGVAAVNATTKEFAPQFEDLKVTPK